MRYFETMLAVIVFSSAVAALSPGPGPRMSGSDPAEAIESQQNLIGTVTAIEGITVTVKTDAGSSVTFTANDKTAVRRVPPGQTSLANAETIALSDVKVGDRVLVPGGVRDARTPVRQIIVMASEAIAARREQERGDWQTRGLAGRITALDPARREISVLRRSPNGPETIIVSTSGNTRILRYAPDSLRSTDARPGAFSDLRVGDQIRVLGSRNAEGTSVSAEEIVFGSIVRAFGTITDINKAANEITIRNDQTGQIFNVALGRNSVIKRTPPEVAQNIAQRREQVRRQRQERAESTGARPETGGERRRGGAAGQRPRGLQQILEDQPTIAIADLKKGDAVLVIGTQGADASRLTAVNIVTGDAELIRLMQRPQGRRNMSPGLPGSVAGGNPPDDDGP